MGRDLVVDDERSMREFLAMAKAGGMPQRMGNADPAVYFQDVFPSAAR